MIVFLDIDGVVLPVGALGSPDIEAIFKDQEAHFDLFPKAHSPDAVRHLKALLAATNAKLVLHSSWRRFLGTEYAHRFLTAIGLGAEYFHEDHSCPMNFSSHKPYDIGQWLDDHPDVVEAIIIDDDPFEVWAKRPHGIVRLHRITPISNVGLSEGDVAKIIKIVTDAQPDVRKSAVP